MCNRNHLVRRRGMRTAPVDGVRSTLRNLRLGGLAERAKATPVRSTYWRLVIYKLFWYHIVNHIVGGVSRYVSYRGSAYHYTPSKNEFSHSSTRARGQLSEQLNSNV